MYTTRLGDHGQLLELLLVKLGLYTELLLAGLGFTKREYARTCCWLDWGCIPRAVDLVVVIGRRKSRIG